jgi:hypothetical protein
MCGEWIKAIAVKCRFCGEVLDADEAEVRLPGSSGAPTNEADAWLVPTNVNGWAMASGYLGLISFFPLLGVLTGIAAIIMGLVALKQLPRKRRQSGYGRAWFGIIAGSLGLLGHAVIILMILVSSRGK